MGEFVWLAINIVNGVGYGMENPIYAFCGQFLGSIKTQFPQKNFLIIIARPFSIYNVGYSLHSLNFGSNAMLCPCLDFLIFTSF